ncbi:hypothetical protein BBJ28_00013294 [Nothophytophthora sp. Chile5]|nr:hypothetical protein BBJ28_00013294 [Nothophytophthora sp. Chile5]
MSHRTSASGRDSFSESDAMSIAPGSLDSVDSLRGSKPRRVIYEMDEDDTHSELDVDLYNTDEVPDSGRSSYRFSLGSDGFESILSAPDSPHEELGEEGTFPAYRHNRNDFNSFVSVDTASELNELSYPPPRAQAQPPLHLLQLQQQQQRLQALQRQQQEQIQQQQQRYPGAYEAASISSSSFYQYLRSSLALAGGLGGGSRASSGEFEPAVSAAATARPPQHSNDRQSAGPMHSDAFIRTNFTSATARDAPLGTPKDPYDPLGTPPGDPPSSRPASEGNGGFAPFDEIHAQALQHLPRSMNSFVLLLLMAVGYAIGFVALTADPPAIYGYWLNEVGTLYIRLVNCAAVPMGVCQVVFSVATLSARRSLWRLWLKTLGFFFAICLLSVAMAIVVAVAFGSSLRQQRDLDLATSGSPFGFQCSNARFLELSGTSLSCNADSMTDSSAVFPRLVDVNSVLGLPETVATISLTQYLFVLLERYVPNNIVQALSEDTYLSSMVVATILGVAVTRSFNGGGGDARRNPLLRLFVHLYAALFTILDWLQSLALLAVLPLTIGSVMVDPGNTELASLAGNLCLGAVLVCAIEVFVVCPLLFYWFTRRHPFGWLLKVMPALLYSVLLQSSMLPLAIATKIVLRSREVPPAVFGALFPVLAAANRLGQALGVPLSLFFVANYTDCGLQLDFGGGVKLLGLSVIASLGDTSLPHSQLVYFFTIWKGFCGSEDVPAAPLVVGGVLWLVSRLQAFTNMATNLMLVRMAACTDEGRMYAQHYAM